VQTESFGDTSDMMINYLTICTGKQKNIAGKKKYGDIFKTYSEKLHFVQRKRIQRHKTSD
jgi:D-mannonate dehydratase